MKIRRYKGTSQEKLYEAIQRELGPDAVIVSSRQTTEMKGFMPRRLFEVVAVADDATADTQLLNRAGGGANLQKITTQQDERWKIIEDRLDRLCREVRVPTRNTAVGMDQSSDQPDFAQDWTRVFCARCARKSRNFSAQLPMPPPVHASVILSMCASVFQPAANAARTS